VSRLVVAMLQARDALSRRSSYPQEHAGEEWWADELGGPTRSATGAGLPRLQRLRHTGLPMNRGRRFLLPAARRMASDWPPVLTDRTLT
jgi:hypothetical protein